MDLKVTTLDGKAAGTVALAEDIFGLEPRADILQRMVRYQLSKRQAGTHKAKTRGEITATTQKMYKQKGTGRARHGAKTAPQFRGGGKAFGPVVRSHAHDLPKKVRALALKHALSDKARGEKLIVHLRSQGGRSQDQGACRPVQGAGARQCADRRRRRARGQLRACRPQHHLHRRAAGAGHQRLRHPSPRHAGADQGRRRRADGAVQMSAHSHYDIIRRPVITEKSTTVSEHNKVIFVVAEQRHQA